MQNIKKLISSLLVILAASSALFAAELTAKQIAVEASKKENLTETVTYLKTQLKTLTVPSEKRAVYIFLASVQEQMALFNDAQVSYATAAGIAAGDSEGMVKKTNEQLVLDAVRCALSAGDFPTADSYLNSAVRNSKNEIIQAYIKLYTQWSALCRAETVADLQEPILLLQAYAKVDSMKAVHPAIYLTLWYVTGEKKYAGEITTHFPNSIEASIVKGDAQLLPTPFWFFVPKAGEIEQGLGTFAVTEDVKTQPEPKNVPEAKITKWQLGLFKTESNAKLLVEEVRAKGFNAYVTSEKRASGTTYYLVLVDEDKDSTIADKLRSNGYDCYALE